jgi:8-oxo-dGTP pyrophosphatase MutT (NUDIX family)
VAARAALEQRHGVSAALLALLSGYLERNPDERACVARIRALVAAHPDCCLRSCLPGHVTASAWVLSPDGRSFLLTHHRKLDRWLQLGGHADGESDVARVALREASEESGVREFAFLGPAGVGPSPYLVDVDVHPIPARPGEPAHDHHDLRFVLVAGSSRTLASPESRALAWFPMAELDARLDALGADESLRRLGRKARALALRVEAARFPAGPTLEG